MQCHPDSDDPFSFDGTEITGCTGFVHSFVHILFSFSGQYTGCTIRSASISHCFAVCQYFIDFHVHPVLLCASVQMNLSCHYMAVEPQ